MTNYNTERYQQKYLQRLVGPRERTIKGVMIHATRGGRSAGDDGPGTENWGNNPNNSGAFWDGLIYENGQQVRGCPDEDYLQPLWCAGYGTAGTWSAQDYYFQLELGQGTIEDPFTIEELTSAAQWVAELAGRHGFAIQRIPYLSQVGTPPEGICSHEGSANGRYSGKSDPGPMFPWDRFIPYCNFFLENDVADEKELFERVTNLEVRMTNIENFVYGLTGQEAVAFSRKAAGAGVPALQQRMTNMESDGDTVARTDIEQHLKDHPTPNGRGGIVPHTHTIGGATPL